jgi:hypothetical protein
MFNTRALIYIEEHIPCKKKKLHKAKKKDFEINRRQTSINMFT